jgi:hypothetical protein
LIYIDGGSNIPNNPPDYSRQNRIVRIHGQYKGKRAYAFHLCQENRETGFAYIVIVEIKHVMHTLEKNEKGKTG